MSQTLNEIANDLINAQKKVQFIYAFNGMGKTRLSKEVKNTIAPKLINEDGEAVYNDELSGRKFLYYNAFTEDLFYWDNDLKSDSHNNLKIQPNSFINWLLETQGLEPEIIRNFQRYTNNKTTPKFQLQTDDQDNPITPKAYEVIFSYSTGNNTTESNIKISKGEESNLIWSVFYSLIEDVLEILNTPEADRSTQIFNDLEYIFIDDPVSSLDENHLIELAVDITELIKSSPNNLRFIVTTHNPLFFNVLFNEFRNEHDKAPKYTLSKLEDGSYSLDKQPKDSPFSYHLYLKEEIEQAIAANQVKKYHFNFLRNILEKTATFVGKGDWVDMLPQNSESTNGNITPNPYAKRLVNLFSHAKQSGDEIYQLSENDKRMLTYLIQHINDTYQFAKRVDNPISRENTTS